MNDRFPSFKVDPRRIPNQLSETLVFCFTVLLSASCAEPLDTQIPTHAKRDKGTSGSANATPNSGFSRVSPSTSTGQTVSQPPGSGAKPAVTPKVSDSSSAGQPPAPPAPMPPALNPSSPPPSTPPTPAPTALCTPEVNCTNNSISPILLRCSTTGQNTSVFMNLQTGQDSCPKVKAAIDGVGLPSGNTQIPPTMTGGRMLNVSCLNGAAAIQDGDSSTDYAPRRLPMPNSVCTEFRNRLNSLKLSEP